MKLIYSKNEDDNDIECRHGKVLLLYIDWPSGRCYTGMNAGSLYSVFVNLKLYEFRVIMCRGQVIVKSTYNSILFLKVVTSLVLL